MQVGVGVRETVQQGRESPDHTPVGNQGWAKAGVLCLVPAEPEKGPSKMVELGKFQKGWRILVP